MSDGHTRIEVEGHEMRTTEMVRRELEHALVKFDDGEAVLETVDDHPPADPAYRRESGFECSCGEKFLNRDQAEKHLLDEWDGDEYEPLFEEGDTLVMDYSASIPTADIVNVSEDEMGAPVYDLEWSNGTKNTHKAEEMDKKAQNTGDRGQ